jgi:hypothetical protein
MKLRVHVITKVRPVCHASVMASLKKYAQLLLTSISGELTDFDHSLSTHNQRPRVNKERTIEMRLLDTHPVCTHSGQLVWLIKGQYVQSCNPGLQDTTHSRMVITILHK